MEAATFLSEEALEAILARIPSLRIAVVGDLFLDRYLDLDAQLTEPSLETGLGAYQVVQVRSNPGAAGTVINNLAALGVGTILPLTILGDDGEGYELRQALSLLPAVDHGGLVVAADRRTPTYTKPLLCEPGKPPRELNRLDIKNRKPLGRDAQGQLIQRLNDLWKRADALVVLDQVSEADCGVLTAAVREAIAELAGTGPKPAIADSRERIGKFRGVSVKPNRRECLGALGAQAPEHLPEAAGRLARQTGRYVFCTDGPEGIIVAGPDVAPHRVPACPVCGPIDPVGAGDSTSAAIICALAAGASAIEAAALGNLVASITIQQLGTTGTARPDQVRQRWRDSV